MHMIANTMVYINRKGGVSAVAANLHCIFERALGNLKECRY